MAYSAERKLRSEFDICKWRVKFIFIPWVAGVGAMVWLFLVVRFSDGYTATDWLAYDIMAIYFLSVCAYSLWCLFNDPPSRTGAGIYLFAVGWGLVAATCRVLQAVDEVPNMVSINIANASNSLALSLFAGGAAWMWKMRLRSINRYGSSKGSLKRIV